MEKKYHTFIYKNIFVYNELDPMILKSIQIIVGLIDHSSMGYYYQTTCMFIIVNFIFQMLNTCWTFHNMTKTEYVNERQLSPFKLTIEIKSEPKFLEKNLSCESWAKIKTSCSVNHGQHLKSYITSCHTSCVTSNKW